MPAPHIVRPVKITIHIGEDLYGKLSLLLFSSLEKKIPFGAYRKFFEARIREYFEPGLDIGPVLGLPANQHIVKGSAETLKLLNDFIEST